MGHSGCSTLDMAHTGAQQAICDEKFEEWREALTRPLSTDHNAKSNCFIKDIPKFIGTMTWVRQCSGPPGVGSFEGETVVRYPPGEQYDEWVTEQKQRRKAKALRRLEARKGQTEPTDESGGDDAELEEGEPKKKSGRKG